MGKDTAVIEFVMLKRKEKVDLEIPLFISANELVVALNNAYQLNIDTSNTKSCYFKSERPIAFLQGDRSLDKFGIRNGSVIYFTE